MGVYKTWYGKPLAPCRGLAEKLRLWQERLSMASGLERNDTFGETPAIAGGAVSSHQGASKHRGGTSAYFRLFGPYTGTDPGFYDASAFPWVPWLESSWLEVREEFERFRSRQGELPGHFVPDPVPIRGWKGVKLWTFGRAYRGNLRSFPRTVRVLQAIPGLVSASINVLEPGTVLPVHSGDSDLCFRAHLGLVVPAGVELCGIQVGEERRGWQEGRVLVFNDAHPHFVWNRSTAPRVILLCDVLKPEHAENPLRSCAMVLATIALLYVRFRVPATQHWPVARWQRLLHATAIPFAAYLRLFGHMPRTA